MSIKQFNDPECQNDIDNEENTRVGDGIYPLMVHLNIRLFRSYFQGPWSTWTGCDKICEQGTQTRVRYCVQEDMCENEKQKMERPCNEKIRKSRRNVYKCGRSDNLIK